MAQLPPVTLEDIKQAAATLRGHAVRTPLLNSPEIDARIGARVLFKPEVLQRTGSFKFRGAYTRLCSIPSERRAAGVVAFSSGNHAQGVAAAARLLGMSATIVMPADAPAAKIERTRNYGAQVVLYDRNKEDREAIARGLVQERGATLVPPYDDPLIIAGQGTVGLEIAADLPDVGTVLVPVGGGGLSAGVATAIKLCAPRARVVGVEPASAPKLSRAREAGRPVRIPSSAGLADGLLAVEVGGLTFEHHQQYVDEVVQVDDAALGGAMRLLLDRMKLVAEPSGAITVAALMEGLVQPRGRTVALLSGGNIEWGGLVPLLSDA
jgi:threonine dehydratase